MLDSLARVTGDSWPQWRAKIDFATVQTVKLNPANLNHALASNPSSLNRYSYVANDPVNSTDPSGNNPLIPACAGGALVSVAADLAVSLFQGEKITGNQVLRSAGMGCVAGLTGFGVGKLASKGIAALVGAAGPRIAQGGTKVLYRAVSRSELDDVLGFGGFRAAAGGQSMGTKLFAESLPDAKWWGNQLYTRVGSEFHIVEVRIPSSFAQQLERVYADSRMMTVVYPELLEQFNTVARITVLR